MSAQTYREHVVTVQRDELRIALRELCDKLPKCEEPSCDAKAEVFADTPHYRYDLCVGHSAQYPGDHWSDLPWADPLRKALKLLGDT